MPPKVSRPSLIIAEEAASASHKPQQQQHSKRSGGGTGPLQEQSGNSGPRRNVKMASDKEHDNNQQPPPTRTSTPLFDAAGTAATAISMFERVEPDETSEAATAALIDLAIDQWQKKQRHIASRFNKQVNDHIKATEDACSDACRRVEERCESSLQVVMQSLENDGGRSDKRSSLPAAMDAGSMLETERENLEQVRQLLIGDLCTTLQRCVDTLRKSNSVATSAQIEAHYQDRPRLLREQRRALVRKYKNQLAEQEAFDESSIRADRTLELLRALVLL